MARSILLDHMRSHCFWLFDVSPSASVNVTTLGTPFMGFQSITAPELTANVQNVNQLGRNFSVPYYTGYEVGTITLTRGVRFFDSTFMTWFITSMSGMDRPNRDFILVHMLFNTNLDSVSKNPHVDNPMGSLNFLGDVETLRTAGKGYLLKDCVPVRYKAGTDFDGSSSEVSVAEIDMQPKFMLEVSLDPLYAAQALQGAVIP